MSRQARLARLGRRLAASRRVQVAFVLAALGAAAATVVVERDAVLDALSELQPVVLVGGLLLTAVNVLAAAQAWRSVLTDLGSPLPWRTAWRVFLVGSLGKYLPGSVWFLLAQMELAARYGVARSRAGSASIVTVVLTVTTALMASLAVIPFAPGTLPRALGWVQLLLPLLVVVLWPPVLNRGLGRVLRALGREPLERGVSAGGTLLAVLWSLLSWLAVGGQVALLAITVGAPAEPRTLAICLGGYALAWAAGFAAVVAPAGAGAREAVLLLVLATVLPPGGALVVALVSRLMLTACDFGLAGLSALGAPAAGAPRGEADGGRA